MCEYIEMNDFGYVGEYNNDNDSGSIIDLLFGGKE